MVEKIFPIYVKLLYLYVPFDSDDIQLNEKISKAI